MDEELALFIRGTIRSVWALETLLLVRRDPAQAWTSESLARELRGNVKLAADLLSALETAGLLARREDGFAYAPATSALDDLSLRLEQTYRQRPVAVINAIVASRDDPVRSFADAFRFRGDPKKP
jgi:hypothetical protein